MVFLIAAVGPKLISVECVNCNNIIIQSPNLKQPHPPHNSCPVEFPVSGIVCGASGFTEITFRKLCIIVKIKMSL